jgi:hypothetical protein
MLPSRFVLGALVALLPSCGAGMRTDGRQFRHSGDLRVTRAVLYQNGIGYFERRGVVKGNTMTLRIRPDQIADFLKSLTVVDLGENGRAVSVALPVEKTQARLLADLPPQVREQGGILAIAAAFRGARCEVETNDGDAEGRIVGVERIEVQTGSPDKPNGFEWRLTILDHSTLRSFRVAEIKALRILDDTLTLGLEKALDVTLNEGSWKPIELTVQLAGKGPHDIVVSYVVEMPTWKPAYRVVVGNDGKALLQGWAVVDNVSGEDWENIQLSLTAGTPLAFRYDLYTPHFIRRPDLSPVQEQAGVAIDPNAYGSTGGGYGGEDDMVASEEEADWDGDQPAKPSTRAPAPPMSQPRPSKAERTVTEADLERNYRTLVAGAGVGSLFRYDLQERISVRDRESALVSVVSTKVPGEDVMVFRVGIDSRNPYRSVRLKNETGFVLERGPVAIYRDSTFLGEALTSKMEKGSTAFVPYAIDGRVDVFLEQHTENEGMRLASIVNGRIIAESKNVTRYTYEVTNRSGEKGTLYVQRGRRTGWTIRKVGYTEDDAKGPLQPGKDGVILEESMYSVPIALPENGKVSISVEEETPSTRHVEILSSEGREVIAAYLSSPDADKEVSRQLKQAFDISDRLAAIDRRMRDLDGNRRMLSERQQQVRDNMTLLHKTQGNADLRKQLEVKLLELEKQLDVITREYVELSEERAKLTEALAAVIKTVTLKKK